MRTAKLLVIAALAACGDDTADIGPINYDAAVEPMPFPQVAPVLTSFTASPSEADSGIPLTIQWNWSYAGLPNPAPSCTIDNGVGAVERGDTTTLTLTAVTVFTISCTSSAGTGTREVVVGLGPPFIQSIDTFTATPMTVPTSTPTNVQWNWTYFTPPPNPLPDCTISPTVGAVTNGQSTSLTLASSTSFTLSCTNVAGTRTRNLFITTSTPPALATFTATPMNVPASTPTSVTFNFTYSNVPSPTPTCVIDQGIGTITNGSSRSVTQAATTTYTLTCTNAGGMSSLPVTITTP